VVQTITALRQLVTCASYSASHATAISTSLEHSINNIRCGRRIEQLGRLHLLAAPSGKEGKSRVMLTIRAESKLACRRASATGACLGGRKNTKKNKGNAIMLLVVVLVVLLVRRPLLFTSFLAWLPSVCGEAGGGGLPYYTFQKTLPPTNTPDGGDVA